MKLKKLISKGLVIGLLFNSISTSFASTLSEDGRYETFEGNNITINDILEEDKVDIEIDGNTLVNLYSKEIPTPVQGSMGKIDDIYKITRGENNKNATYLQFQLNPSLFKSNTDYTIIIKDYKASKMENISLYDREHEVTISVHNQSEFINNKKLYSIGNLETSNLQLLIYCGTTTDDWVEISDEIVILEGDWTDKEIPKYFEGIKSVGELENNNVNIEVLGENLFNVEYFTEMIETHYDEGNYAYEAKDDRNTIWVSKNHDRLNLKDLLNNNYKFKEKTQYIIKGDIFVNEESSTGNNMLRGDICYTDKTTQRIFDYKGVKDTWITTDVITEKNKTIESIYFTYGSKDSSGYFDLDSIYIAEYNPDKIEFNYAYNMQNLELNLNEPLRSLPNGVKDKIVKKNGQWVVERNCIEVEYNYLNTSFSDWGKEEADDDYITFILNRKTNADIHIEEDIIKMINSYQTTSYVSDRFKVGLVGLSDECIQFYNRVHISLLKTKLETPDIYGGMKWFESNPLNIVYELAEPIYEPLNIDPTINLYLDTTYISNNSNIPANMKITVDRTINRATEAIELAKENPNVENLSKARLWANLLKESTLKDELSNQINNITNVGDLTIEKKTTTSNMDLYIKPENSLSMSLSTNNIIFEDYSSVSDIDMDNAVQITINSSLPYQLNSYLETEIQNKDGTSKIDKDKLHIKEDSENEYKQFLGINQKLILKDKCLQGNNIIHNIDFKLKASTHDADIYKTTIKFEAEQK